MIRKSELVKTIEKQSQCIESMTPFIELMESYIGTQETKFELLTSDMRELVLAYREAKGAVSGGEIP